MSIVRQAFRPLVRFADFGGRASRAEYWGFTLLAMTIGLIAVAIELRLALPRIALVFGPLTLALALLLFVPGLAVQARRLHDVNLSGWWALMLWAPYLASMLFFYDRSRAGMDMFFDSSVMPDMLLLTSLQALGGFALLSLLVQRGTRRSNAYGEDPYRAAEPAPA